MKIKDLILKIIQITNNLPIVFKLTSIAGLVTAFAVSVSALISFNNSVELLLTKAVDSMEASISRQTERLNNSIEQVRQDALFVSHTENIQGLIRAYNNDGFDNEGNMELVEWQERLEHTFSVMIKAKGYLRVRFIELKTGNELVRVDKQNSNTKIFRNEELQSKIDRDYIKRSQNLQKNQTYISPINLNRDNGNISTPWQPTQRFIAPIFTKNNNNSSINEKIAKLFTDLHYHHEILNMSTISALQSGDIKWIKRHKKYHNNFHKILNNLIELNSLEINEILKQYENIHETLIDEHKKVFVQITENKLEEAKTLLDSSFYRTQNKMYNETVQTILTLIKKSMSSELFGIVVINTDANKLMNSLETSKLFNVILINDTSGILRHPEPNRAWGFEFGKKDNLKDNEPYLWGKILKQKQNVIWDEYDDVHVFNKVIFDKNRPDKFLTLILSAKKSDVLVDINDLRFDTVIISIIAIIFAIIFAILIVKALIKPVLTLTKQASLIADGNRELKIATIKSNDEIGILNNAIAYLVNKLQQSNKEVIIKANALNELNLSLESKVKERTAEAEMASCAKSEFLAVMSHEIRTPMNAVLGMSELLQDTELSDEQADYLKTLEQSGNALLSIINDILDFSKIEAGKMVLESIDFDLEQLSYDVLNILANRADKKGVELIFSYEISCPHNLIGDAGRIRQILTNLLNNAIKFTEKGYVIVNIKCDINKDELISKLFIEIEDTGIGIEPEVQKQLFQSFTQADASTTRKFGGTGLGLAITKQLIELMDGEIKLESEYGKGTKFIINVTLPVSETISKRYQTAELKDKKILIVDDNRVNLQILAKQLEFAGMITKTTTNPAQALTILNDQTKPAFDLVILDYLMPVMDGEELSNQIRANNCDIPLLLLTSSVHKVISKNFAVCLTKPVHGSILRQNLSNILGDKLKIEDKNLQVTAFDNIKFNANILLVEDIKANQKVALLMLKKLGIIADLAENGQEALEKIQISTYDLIFMDCQMPILDGYETTKQIRRLEKNKNTYTPIIALTANAMQDEQKKCFTSGMDDYIAKPFKRLDLVEKLQQYLVKNTNIEKHNNDVYFDKNVIAELRKNIDNEQEFIDILKEIKIEIDNLYSELFKYYIENDTSDIANLRLLSHSLKSCCAMIGAMKLSKLSSDIENSMLIENIDNFIQQFKALDKEYKIMTVKFKAKFSQI
jgi:signal transduction histidine kinase/CheY-like chemotaxis protein